MGLVSCVFLGVGVGLSSSILGLGGGVLIVPLLPMLTGMSQREAIATSMFSVFFVVAGNCIGFTRQKLIHWKLGLMLGPMTAIFSFVTARLAYNISDTGLKGILAAIMWIFALKLIFERQNVSQTIAPLPSVKRNIWIVGSGGLSGIVYGLSGVGVGLILNPIFIFFRWVENHRVAPTVNSVMLFTTFFGSLAFATDFQLTDDLRFGLVHIDKALILVLTAWAVAFFGRKYQAKLGRLWRRRIFSVILILLGSKVFFDFMASR